MLQGKEVEQKLQRPKVTGNYEADIKEIVKRLGEGAEKFAVHGKELELMWEWKRNQNGDFKTLKEKIFAMDKEAANNAALLGEKLGKRFEEQLEKQKKEIEELVRPVCEAVEMLQKGANAKDTVKEFKGKVAESSLKYLTGGTALILAFWKIFDLVKSAMAAKGN